MCFKIYDISILKSMISAQQDDFLSIDDIG